MSDARWLRWTERHTQPSGLGEPSPFVVAALDRLGENLADPSAEGPPRALDVACGRGRHAVLLASRGFAVDAVDYALPALRALRQTAHDRRLTIRCLAADVTAWPLPARLYRLVVVVSFLERPLFSSLRAAVTPGGALLMETFVRDEAIDDAMNPAFVLRPGELERLCDGWEVLARRDIQTQHEGRPVARAGVLARRPAEPTGPRRRAH